VPFQQIAVDDIGRFVARAFESPDEWIGRELDIAGDERTMPEIAAAFGEAIGRPVEYVQVPWDAYREAAGEEYYEMYRWFSEVGYNADIRKLEQEYPPLTRFEEYLARSGWGQT
jgi:nucleoside-diphosphate-sugar epimerase